MYSRSKQDAFNEFLLSRKEKIAGLTMPLITFFAIFFYVKLRWPILFPQQPYAADFG